MYQVDYIIVGQGLCGTFLSYQFYKNNISFALFDEAKELTASKVASGVINPVTGRRLVKTWMIDEVMPQAVKQYKDLEKLLKSSLIKQCDVVDFHPNLQMQLEYEKRIQQQVNYLHPLDDSNYFSQYFNYEFSASQISPCWLVDINKLLQQWQLFLLNKNSLFQENFDYNNINFTNNFIAYKNIKAKAVIFCDGVQSVHIPFFKALPFAPNKGEAIIAQIKNLPANNIYKNGISIVPWQDDLFWIGSSYNWQFSDALPTQEFASKVCQNLNKWLKLPYRIIKHIASVRPANIERRPFVGFLKHQPQIGILNGMGTKGCSLAPYFAQQLTQHIINATAVNAEIDVNRFF